VTDVLKLGDEAVRETLGVAADVEVAPGSAHVSPDGIMCRAAMRIE
jgi:hypothetical protein